MSKESAISRFFRRIEVFVFYHPKAFLSGILLMTVFFASQVPYLQMYSNFADLLPQEHPYIKLHNEIRDSFGGANNIMPSTAGEPFLFLLCIDFRFPEHIAKDTEKHPKRSSNRQPDRVIVKD